MKNCWLLLSLFLCTFASHTYSAPVKYVVNVQLVQQREHAQYNDPDDFYNLDGAIYKHIIIIDSETPPSRNSSTTYSFFDPSALIENTYFFYNRPNGADDILLTPVNPGGFFYTSFNGDNYEDLVSTASVTDFGGPLTGISAGDERAWLPDGFLYTSQHGSPNIPTEIVSGDIQGMQANALSARSYDHSGSGDASGYSYYTYYQNMISFSASPIPIPAAAWLFGTALLVLFGLKRRI